MLNTLERVFKHCRYFLINRGYFNVVCGEEPLVYLPSKIVRKRIENSKLISSLLQWKINGEFREIMEALEINFKNFPRSSSKINTMDLPIVEFAASSLSCRQF